MAPKIQDSISRRAKVCKIVIRELSMCLWKKVKEKRNLCPRRGHTALPCALPVQCSSPLSACGRHTVRGLSRSIRLPGWSARARGTSRDNKNNVCVRLSIFITADTWPVARNLCHHPCCRLPSAVSAHAHVPLASRLPAHPQPSSTAPPQKQGGKVHAPHAALHGSSRPTRSAIHRIEAAAAAAAAAPPPAGL